MTQKLKELSSHIPWSINHKKQQVETLKAAIKRLEKSRVNAFLGQAYAMTSNAYTTGYDKDKLLKILEKAVQEAKALGEDGEGLASWISQLAREIQR